MKGEQHELNFLIFMLITSGGISLTLAKVQPLQNVTKKEGGDAVIDCTADSTSTTNKPYWNIYNPRQKSIYNPSMSDRLDSSKYSVGNGNNTLTVKNLKLEDGATYCCAFDPATEYCANLVVIGTVTALVNPSNGVDVGNVVNLTCSFLYYSPTKDINGQLPLSDDQDPQVSVYIGDNQISNSLDEEVVGTTGMPHSKTLSVNRTAEYKDIGQQLVCRVSSKNPQYNNHETAALTIYAATTEAEIVYPAKMNNSGDIYPLNSAFNCTGDGYPPPNSEWLNGDMRSFRPPVQGRPNATWIAKQPGIFNLICSAGNDRSQHKSYQATTVIVENAGPTAESKSSNNKVGLGVRLGIGLGVSILIGIIVLIIILSRVYKRRKASWRDMPVPTTSTTPVSNTGSSSQMGTDPYWIQTAPPPYTTAAESKSMSYENTEAPPLYSSLIASEPNVYQAIVRTPDMMPDEMLSTVTTSLA